MNLKEKHYVGVDCHKNSIACYINSKFKEFKTDFKGFTKALEWVRKIEPNCAWAIEGAYSYGLTLRTKKGGNRSRFFHPIYCN